MFVIDIYSIRIVIRCAGGCRGGDGDTMMVADRFQIQIYRLIEF